MRHRKKGRKLGVDASHKKALLRNLFTSLLTHRRIKTTEAKGKELIQFANRLIEKALKDNLASRREVSSHITTKEVSKNFLKQILPKTSFHHGGHVRLTKIGTRKGDGASMVIIELMTKEE